MCSLVRDPKKATSNIQPVPAPIPSGCLELLEDFGILNADLLSK